MSFSESQLKALKVGELKEHLTVLGLPTSGKKEELIARILASAPAEAATGDDFDPLLAPPQDFDWNADEDSAAPPPPVPAAEPIASTPSLAAVDKKLEEAPAVAEASTSSAPPSAIPAPPAPTPAEAAPTVPAAPPAPVLTAEEKTAATAADIEKKKARAARFGVPYVEKSEPTPPRKATATLPPSSKATAAKPAARTKPTTAAAAAVPVVAAAKKELDPAEEEKKRKRAEKFGPVAVPAEKKTKTD